MLQSQRHGMRSVARRIRPMRCLPSSTRKSLSPILCCYRRIVVACIQASATSESIEIESSHCGMGHHPAAVYAVADRLAQPEGKWTPFDRSGWRTWSIRIRIADARDPRALPVSPVGQLTFRGGPLR